jgi:hypothetical protein
VIVGAIISAVVIHSMIDELAVLSIFLAIPESARRGAACQEAVSSVSLVARFAGV